MGIWAPAKGGFSQNRAILSTNARWRAVTNRWGERPSPVEKGSPGGGVGGGSVKNGL